jgi:hypothetical protein
LPLAAPEAYPLFAEMSRSGGVRRPDARALTLAEALLRAFADTTEADLDAGRWQRDVATFDGRVTVVLSLPDIPRRDPDRRGRGGAVVRRTAAGRAGQREDPRISDSRRSGCSTRSTPRSRPARQAGFLDPDALPLGLGRPLTPLEQAQDLERGPRNHRSPS